MTSSPTPTILACSLNLATPGLPGLTSPDSTGCLALTAPAGTADAGFKKADALSSFSLLTPRCLVSTPTRDETLPGETTSARKFVRGAAVAVVVRLTAVRIF